MKDFKIEDAKTRFFKSKEDYLQFRQAWKDFHNSDQLKWFEKVDVTFWDAPATQDRVYAQKKFTSLRAEHYLLYSLLRGYDIKQAFTEHGEDGWDACKGAMYSIISVAKDFERVNTSAKHSRDWARKNIDAMLLPFAGTVSHQALADIGVELLKYMEYDNVTDIEVEEWILFAAKEAAEKKLSIADRLKMRFA